MKIVLCELTRISFVIIQVKTLNNFASDIRIHETQQMNQA